MLDKEFKEKWCVALESEEFTQQRNGRLRDKDGYCCLGVALQISEGDKGWKYDHYSNSYRWKGGDKDTDETCLTMPSVRFLDKIGLSLGVADHLAVMNDSGAMGSKIQHTQYTFKDIAAYIRANVPAEGE